MFLWIETEGKTSISYGWWDPGEVLNTIRILLFYQKMTECVSKLHTSSLSDMFLSEDFNGFSLKFQVFKEMIIICRCKVLTISIVLKNKQLLLSRSDFKSVLILFYI